MALRRLKPFFDAFHHIDAAIESSEDGLSRDEFRSARARIVEMMCDAADGGEKAEGFCVLLDEAMAESLLTLRAVPQLKIARQTLASGELVGALGKLMREHGSERVRDLARDVVRGWRAGVVEDLARARAAMDVLDGLLSVPSPSSKDFTAGTEFTKKTVTSPPSKDLTAGTKLMKTMTHPTTGGISNSFGKKMGTSNSSCKKMDNSNSSKKMTLLSVADEEKKMEATKRKLQDGYAEVRNMKRRRMMQVIKPPTQRQSTRP